MSTPTATSEFFEVLELPPDPACEPPPFVDLGPFIEGTCGPEKPSVASIGDTCLFYAGRVNEIHGEPGVGKSNVFYGAMKPTLEAGGSVLFIDPEDTPQGFTTRALLFGINPADIEARVFYLHNPEPEHISAAQKWALVHHPDLVILDGLAESMAGVGVNEDKAQEILPFFKSWLRPFAEAGAAVVVADHVTKSTDGRGRFARGSGAKLGRYDGVSYSVELGKAYAPDVEGFLRLRVAKDRNGGVGPVGTVVSELHFIPDINDGGTRLEWRQPEQAGDWQPTAIMEKVVKHLEIYGGASKRDLRGLGNHKYADRAIELLIESGTITRETQGKSHRFTLAKNDK
jgi:hypothetical protein